MILEKENTNSQSHKSPTQTIETTKITKPLIEGHRGTILEANENTLEAFQRAIEIGCNSIEFDVWLTSDKVPMVIHGDENGSIHKTTNGTGLINDTTYEKLSELRTSHNHKVPTLDEVIELCKDKVSVNIEIKDKNFTECTKLIMESVQKYNSSMKTTISSYHHGCYEKVKEYEGIQFGFLVQKLDPSNHLMQSEYKSNSIHMHYQDITKEVVEKVHDINMKFLCYFEGDDVETEDIFRNVFNCGVDVICCNNSRLAIKVRDEMFGI